ncbi:FixH family protein [Sideroxydans lithotrophicus]|uniref:FixH family protein n=1 Tax=Sideroxydans lithotrophicus (strain ES-1) TaxID=580332 RepID=D5CM44_SIDLE|nr:FixH family protein [Sideroxydans lithotrophicus]ADE10658.1 FixH family protein [Sideroxydans lithotrophicus ES-1]
MISQHNKTGLRNPWVWGMLALIAIVLSVNATFVWFATKDTRSTLVERDYKTKDRKSNEELLSELRTQHALSWQTEIKRPEAVVMGTPASYEIGVADRAGKPVSGVMEVVAYRASDASKDFTTTFNEVAPGRYRGYINFPLKGYWELHIRIQRGEDRFGVNTEKFMVAAS